jgi:hypothetical protein
MSHDRGCWKCGKDGPYDDCSLSDCAKKKVYPPEKKRTLSKRVAELEDQFEELKAKLKKILG